MTQLDLIAAPPPKPMGRQLQRVHDLMLDGRPRTLREIADACGCLETSASARLRDLRKRGYRVEKREVVAGLWRYWVR